MCAALLDNEERLARTVAVVKTYTKETGWTRVGKGELMLALDKPRRIVRVAFFSEAALAQPAKTPDVNGWLTANAGNGKVQEKSVQVGAAAAAELCQ